MRDSAWIRHDYGTYKVLCFDTWSDGLVEAWTVKLAQDDIDYILDELRSDKREALTQDLLADYDSEHFDAGTAGYDDLADQVSRGLWEDADEWVADNL